MMMSVDDSLCHFVSGSRSGKPSLSLVLELESNDQFMTQS